MIHLVQILCKDNRLKEKREISSIFIQVEIGIC